MGRQNNQNDWKNIRTDLVLRQMEKAGGIQSFNRMVKEDPSTEGDTPLWVVLLNRFMAEKGLNPSRLAALTGLSVGYVYELLQLKTAGKKRKLPSRDVLIRLAIAAGADLVGLNQILKSASFKELYIKDDRDRYIWEGLAGGMTCEEIDDLLRRLRFRGLEG